MPKEGVYGMIYVPRRVYAIHAVWIDQHHSKSSNNKELRNLIEVVDEEV